MAYLIGVGYSSPAHTNNCQAERRATSSHFTNLQLAAVLQQTVAMRSSGQTGGRLRMTEQTATSPRDGAKNSYSALRHEGPRLACYQKVIH